MWPFTRKQPPSRPADAEADPLGAVCRLVIDRWWEWDPYENTIRGQAYRAVGIRHASDVALLFTAMTNGTPNVWYGPTAVTNQQLLCTPGAARRLYNAYQTWLVLRVQSPPPDADRAAVLMAKAVLAGKLEAARGLADWLVENVNRPAPEEPDEEPS